MKRNYNFKQWFLSFTFVTIFVNLEAQIPNPINFNSASDAAATGTLLTGSNDLNWVASATGTAGPWVPAIVCGNQATCCWFNSTTTNANWITYPHTCSSSPAEHSCLGNVDEFYKLSFNLPAQTPCGQAIIETNAYCLVMDLFADNCIWEIFVNGTSVYTSTVTLPYGHTGFIAGPATTFSLCSNWLPGTNDVIVHVKSGAPSFPGWTGFMAIANPTMSSGPSSYLPPAISASSSSMICAGSSATLTASGAVSYVWNPGSIAGSVITVSPTTTTNYTVTGTGSNNCQGTTTVTQIVSDCTGINENKHVAETNIYPNPTTGIINFTPELLSKKADIEVYNSLGQLIKKQTLNFQSTAVDLSNETSGLYYIKINSADRQHIFKIIKQLEYNAE